MITSTFSVQSTNFGTFQDFIGIEFKDDTGWGGLLKLETGSVYLQIYIKHLYIYIFLEMTSGDSS